MQIAIDPVSNVPLYQQLRDRVVEGIASGELSAGEPLAPVRQLAAQFGINPATVAKGYDLLRAEGLLLTHRTAGSVVARDPRNAPWHADAEADWSARLRTLLAEAVAQGMPDDGILQHARSALQTFSAARPTSDSTTKEDSR
ncbi:GntR family transcriptional regulator [Humibacter sp. RRB41]|uniref:GntR family transcriptional regulator n=1 Tax=Humibacter sp. RRB41 TaxID=2919946 RepID=UPI001FAA9F1A|nr:GntR family transcriptional regulator [Humibacter sp. RRB41]